MRASINFLLASIVVVGNLVGCGGTTDAGQAVSARGADTQYRGAVEGTGISGEATIVVHAADAAAPDRATVKALITIGSTIIHLRGTLDPDGMIRLAGSGWSASLAIGEGDGSVIHGQLVSPGGAVADLVAIEELEGSMAEYCLQSRPVALRAAPGMGFASMMAVDPGNDGGGAPGEDTVDTVTAAARQDRVCTGMAARAAGAAH